MFQTWLVLTITALMIWGVWGMFANLTARYVGGFSALVWEVLGAVIVGVTVLGWLVRNGGLETSVRGAGFGLMTGITYAMGLTLFFLALNLVSGQEGRDDTASRVNTILVLTALYPIITVALHYFFLNEAVSPRQLIGMAIGLAGVAILVTS